MKLLLILKLTFLTIAYLSTHVKSENDQNCYVLALAGGGAKGAYQTGAFKAFSNLIPEQIHWDVITGISIGSINGGVLSTFEKGNEKEASEFLYDVWNQVKTSNLWVNWWYGPIPAFYFKTSLFDTSVQREFIKKNLADRTFKRDSICGAVSYLNGEYVTFNSDDLSPSEIVDAVISSASVPFVFPPNHFKNNYFMDGMFRNNLDLISGIQKCISKGFPEKNIIVDAVLLNSAKYSEVDPNTLGPLGMWGRSTELGIGGLSMGQFEEALEYFDVKFRYVIIPERTLPDGFNLINFTHQDIVNMLNWGEEDATAVIKKGPGVNFEEKLKIHRENKKNKWMRTKK